MRIAITGVTGFLGGRLAQHLHKADHELVGLSRSADAALAAQPALHSAHDWDPLTGPPPAAAFEGVDAVIHLAGEPVTGRWNARKRAAIHASRVTGTAHLIEALSARAEPPGVLVSASAIGYYGDRADEELDETAEPGTDFLAKVCVDWESATAPAAELGWRLVQPRIGVVLGQGGGALPAMLPMFKKGLGGRLGSGRQWWSWIHVDDLVGIFHQALIAPLQGPVNVVAPGAARQQDFAKLLAGALGKGTFLPTPGFALKLGLGGFATELLSSKHCLPTAALAAGYDFSHPELAEALDDLL